MEQHGFRYSKSQIKFSRKIHAFTQTVEFSLSKWNAEDDCQFWTMWGVHSSAYSKWYKDEWGEKPVNNALGGCADWNIPGWTRGVSEHFNLRNAKADSSEIETLTRNVQQAGFPYLERISSWQGAAEDLLASKWMYCKAADFLLIAGEKQRAKEAVLEGIQNSKPGGPNEQFDELADLERRLKRYF